MNEEAVTIPFGTKAETLERLAPVLQGARLLPQLRFTVIQWQQDPEAVLRRVEEMCWPDRPLIVRSSALIEDGSGQSLAGHFLSVAHVIGTRAVQVAVARVIASYQDGPGENQIFIQPMLQKVSLSGVAFSIDPNTGAPYMIINYDDQHQRTDTVTGGDSNDLKTFYYYKLSQVAPPLPLAGVVALIGELESLFPQVPLDVEFAVTQENVLYLLQVRPLAGAQPLAVSLAAHQQLLLDIHRKIEDVNRPHPYLHGQRTVYGVMPDWNPAEIIGVRPRPLALSLYKELVTDQIWAYQRDNYGYKNLRSFPLIVSFGGLPYVDVRVSFNSFIPARLDASIAERLVDYYIDRLVETPSFHDKVEFEIIYSCYTLDLPERLIALQEYGFSADDCEALANSLRRLTNEIIHGEKGLWRQDIDKIAELEKRQAALLDAPLDKISQIYWLLEDCKRYGTLPFAGLARAAFIAVQLLRSLVQVGILNPEEYDGFMGTLNTVSSRMGHDFQYLSQKAFLNRYGHLRPGTYDILSPRYDEAPGRYFDWNKPFEAPVSSNAKFLLSLDQLKRIENLLKEHQLEHDILGLFDFIKAAIEGREYSKFVFTRSLSNALSIYQEMAAEHGLTLEECSYTDINCIHRLYSSSLDIQAVLRQSARNGMAAYALTAHLSLPPIIVGPDDIWSFELPQFEPNFITLKKIVAPVAHLQDPEMNLANHILFIPSADPGYDWIFSQGIAGFVTMYGGVNSHMAIRAGELCIPAVIGAGETLYRQWSKGGLLELDCANKQVKVLK